MKKARKKGKKAWIAVLCVLVVIAIAAAVFMYFGGFNTGKSIDPKELAAYAGKVSDIEIPDNATVVALGEATHGNAEFHRLKLDVFKHLVKDCGVRAFALEGDYGGCEQVNRYIHGGEGTAREAVAAIGFAIYRTQQFEDLVSYMRSYNETAAKGDDLRFYGFDMQRCLYSFRFLCEECKKLDVDSAKLETLVSGSDWSEGYDYPARVKIITDIKTQLESKTDAERAVHLADMLLQYCELQTADSAAYGDVRDELMAKNTLWIAQQEKKLGFDRIFVTAHNGHVARWGSTNDMGARLSKELGKDYYVIGTDFYKTTCNLPDGRSGKRTNQVFYSHDPLAKTAKLANLGICWLDFSKVPAGSALSKLTTDYVYMGTLGEGFSILNRILPPSYRIFQPPATMYDGMIFVPNATPTKIIPAN